MYVTLITKANNDKLKCPKFGILCERFEKKNISFEKLIKAKSNNQNDWMNLILMQSVSMFQVQAPFSLN